MMWMEGGGKLFYSFEVMDKGDSSPPGYSQAARITERGDQESDDEGGKEGDGRWGIGVECW